MLIIVGQFIFQEMTVALGSPTDHSINSLFQIRLLLSSKAEQNAVIAARKNGTYSAPKIPEDFVPPVPSQTSQNQQNWNPKPSGNPYAAKPGYEALYPPQNSNAARMEYNNQNSYNNRPEVPQKHLLSPTKPKETGDFGAYKQSFPQQGLPPPNTNRFLPAPNVTKPVEVVSNRSAPAIVHQHPNNPINHPPNHAPNQSLHPANQSLHPLNPSNHPSSQSLHPPNQSQQFPPDRSFPGKGGVNSDPLRGNNFQGHMHERPSGGDSWRDTSYNQ
ncbi:hypothetical protein CAEBREN_29397 [Caenorhabditis brenneri]|uniref:Uncharacterized protein n=1 Tax=Caenorhabditis brenneri TaxID=135651 RepID=G0P4W3_CAEBE|nr:hypothetical protein CAEBREN_29397 [Caenorhabditis brenneri]